MAWQVLISSVSTVKQPDGYKYRLLAKYYEDTDASNIPNPTIFLWQREFFFDGATLTVQVIQDAVFAEGAKQRMAYNNANTAIAIPALAVGQHYQIP